MIPVVKPLFLQKIIILIVLLVSVSCSPILKSPNSVGRSGNLKNRSISDCHFEFNSVGLCAQIGKINPPFPVGRPVSFRLAFWQKGNSNFTGPYVDPGLVPYAWLWMVMPSGSHGSSSISTNQVVDSNGIGLIGLYDVTQVIFSMPPRNENEWWELHIELKNVDGVKLDEAVQIIWDSSGG